MEPVRVGVWGVGVWGEKHARVYARARRKRELVGVYDRDRGARRARSRRSYGAPRVRRAAEALLAACEAVSIAVPTVAHRAAAERAAAAGRHVLVEKPMAADGGGGRRHDRGRASAPARALQVGQVERFNPALLAARPLVRAPKFIEAHRLALFQPRSLDIDVVFDLMIHDIDSVLRPGRRAARRRSRRSASRCCRSNEDIANARLEFADGCVANLTASRVSQERLRRIRFFQADAYLSVDLFEKTGELLRVDVEPLRAARVDPLAAAGRRSARGELDGRRRRAADARAARRSCARCAARARARPRPRPGARRCAVAEEVRAAMKRRARQWASRDRAPVPDRRRRGLGGRSTPRAWCARCARSGAVPRARRRRPGAARRRRRAGGAPWSELAVIGFCGDRARGCRACCARAPRLLDDARALPPARGGAGGLSRASTSASGPSSSARGARIFYYIAPAGVGVAPGARARDGALGGPARGGVPVRGAAVPRRRRARPPSSATRCSTSSPPRWTRPTFRAELGDRPRRSACSGCCPAAAPRSSPAPARPMLRGGAPAGARRGPTWCRCCRRRWPARPRASTRRLAGARRRDQRRAACAWCAGRTRAVQAYATACAVASGTATLETALFGTPLVDRLPRRRAQLRDRAARGAARRTSGCRTSWPGARWRPSCSRTRLTPERARRDARAAGSTIRARARGRARARLPRGARAARRPGRLGRAAAALLRELAAMSRRALSVVDSARGRAGRRRCCVRRSARTWRIERRARPTRARRALARGERVHLRVLARAPAAAGLHPSRPRRRRAGQPPPRRRADRAHHRAPRIPHRARLEHARRRGGRARDAAHAEAGHLLAITPDGPRGPAERVKPGWSTSRAAAGCRSCRSRARRGPRWRLRSWDRFRVPRPFARRARRRTATPIRVPARARRARPRIAGAIASRANRARSRDRVRARAWESAREPGLARLPAARAGARRARTGGAARSRSPRGAPAVARASGLRTRARAAVDAWIHAASLGEARRSGRWCASCARSSPTRASSSPPTPHRPRAAAGARACRSRWRRSTRRRRCAASSRGVRPARLLLIETELWPHWLLRARRRRVPVAVVSARLSERSVQRYRRLGPAAARAGRGLAAVLCQSDEDARRWLALGARPERTAVVRQSQGRRAAPSVADGEPRTRRAALGLDPARPLLVLGSLRPGEARLLARAWRVARPTAAPTLAGGGGAAPRARRRRPRGRGTRGRSSAREPDGRLPARGAGTTAPACSPATTRPPTWRSWAAAWRPTAATIRSSRRRCGAAVIMGSALRVTSAEAVARCAARRDRDRHRRGELSAALARLLADQRARAARGGRAAGGRRAARRLAPRGRPAGAARPVAGARERRCARPARR